MNLDFSHIHQGSRIGDRDDLIFRLIFPHYKPSRGGISDLVFLFPEHQDEGEISLRNLDNSLDMFIR